MIFLTKISDKMKCLGHKLIFDDDLLYFVDQDVYVTKEGVEVFATEFGFAE